MRAGAGGGALVQGDEARPARKEGSRASVQGKQAVWKNLEEDTVAAG